MRAAQRSWKPACLAVLLLSCLLSACGGEFAYKPGAGADQLAEAKQACRKTEGYEACMNAKGWKVHKLDDDNPLAVFVPNTDSRASEQVFVAADKPSNTPYVAAGAAPVSAASKPTATAAGTPEKKSPPDPMTKFNVSSWWKQGAGAGDLNAGIDACVAKLGPAHAPEVEKKLYTRGLILCLKEQGWYGLQGY